MNTNMLANNKPFDGLTNTLMTPSRFLMATVLLVATGLMSGCSVMTITEDEMVEMSQETCVAGQQCGFNKHQKYNPHDPYNGKNGYPAFQERLKQQEAQLAQ